MLIEFSVGHFLSFKEVQKISMVASSSKGTHFSENRCGIDILRTSLVFGPNASGKSNLLKAIRFSKSMALAGDDPSKLGLDRYLHTDYLGQLDGEPAYFEYVVEIDGVIYRYGMEVDEYFYVNSEWLCILSTDGVEEIVYRYDRMKDNESVQDLREPMSGFLDGDNTELCFLKSASKFNDDCLKLFYWLNNGLIVLASGDNRFIVPYNQEVRGTLLDYLGDTGTGIRDSNEAPDFPNLHLSVKESKLRFISLLKKTSLVENPTHGKEFSLGFYHKGLDDLMPYSLESEGTKRICQIVLCLYARRFVTIIQPPRILKGVQFDKTVFIDEIESSIHTTAIQIIFDKFLKDGPSGTQLIVTAHEHQFLKHFASRDIFWLANPCKLTDGDGRILDESTELYSLDQFDDVDETNLYGAYYSGAYGAVPFLDHYSEDHGGDI